MSKSPGDATRFTATGVWAHTRPGGRATTLQFADPAPKNETPQQKVKRLREAANRAKMAQVTRWDYMYLYGRMAADAAHRFTVYGLIFATGCIGVLATFSIGDMIVYNRRKRAIYLREQERTQADILALARSALAQGTATPAQAALVSGIAEEEESLEKKKAERKLPSRLLWWMHGDWQEEKEMKEQRRLAVEDVQRQDLPIAHRLPATAAEGEEGTRTQMLDAVASTPTPLPVMGGPLDTAAEKAARSAEKTGKGWLGWMMSGPKNG